MSRINDMSVSSRCIDLQDIEKNGGATFKLQDKSVTENGVVIADPTYDGLSKVDVDVQGGGGVTPSTEMPAWFDDYENSIVPNGLQIVGVTRNSSETIILTGDGQLSITELLTGHKTFYEELVSYGESIVFAYSENM